MKSPIKIKVVGVGGSGGNAVLRMRKSGIEDIELIAINTDYNDLKKSKADIQIKIGNGISHGVGTLLLSYIMNKAKQKGRVLRADFKHTGRNRPMYITFKMSNFKEAKDNSVGDIVLENDLSVIPPYPPYLELSVPDESRESIYGRIRPNQRIYQE